MTHPDNNQDDDFQPILRRFDEEFGPRQEEEPAPVYGEAHPIPQQSYRLSLPLRRPRAVWALLAVNVIVFLFSGILSRNVFNPADAVLDLLGAKDNRLIQAGQYWRLVTAMFLHANLIHIGFNAYALYVLGQEAERIYGTARFLALYFIAGLAGSVASYAFTPSNSVGASGAIFGLIGGLAAFYYVARRLLGEISRQQLGSLITVIMINLFIGFSSPVIDNTAHIGGLIGGAVAGWLLVPRFELDERLYPPAIVRRGSPLAWAGALGLLALLVLLILIVKPPIR